jgi:hypothetical protein
VTIYLLRLANGHVVFHSEGPPSDELGVGAEPTSPKGLRAWLDRRAQALSNAVALSETNVVSWLRRLWTWLHRFTHADEAFLRSLRQAKRIKLIFPSSMNPREAQHSWKSYLGSRRRRHLFWLALNLLIVPPAALAAILPGPNVLGYWFVYRAWMHALAWRGASNAKALTKSSVAQSDDLLNERIDLADESQLVRRAHELSLPHLPETLRRPASVPFTPPIPTESDAPADV